MEKVKSNKELKAQIYVERNGNEYLAPLMTRSFIAGHDSNNEVALRLAQKCMGLKDIESTVVWYNTFNSDLQIVPSKVNPEKLVSYLLSQKVTEVIPVATTVEPKSTSVKETPASTNKAALIKEWLKNTTSDFVMKFRGQ